MLGILGGTFDPIHHGHLRLALELRERLGLERVHLLPSAQPPHRNQPVASAEWRLRLVQAALADTPGLLADDRELHRAGPSYMVDTLAELRNEYPQQTLCLILGMDAFMGLAGWRRWQQLTDYAHLVVVRRPNTLAPLSAEMQAFQRHHQADSAARLRQQPNGLLWMQEIPSLHISATEIRTQLKTGANPRYLLPDSVLALIQTHQLYM